MGFPRWWEEENPREKWAKKWLHNSRRKKKVWVLRTEKHKWKCLQPGYSSKGKITFPHGTLKLDRQIIQHEDPEPEARTATMRKESSWSKPPTEPPSSKRETSQTLLHGSDLVRPHGAQVGPKWQIECWEPQRAPLMFSRELWDIAREELHEDKGSIQADSGEPCSVLTQAWGPASLQPH